MKRTHDKLERMYLEWFNNFLTPSAFATYYFITESSARRLIRAYVNLRIKGE